MTAEPMSATTSPIHSSSYHDMYVLCYYRTVLNKIPALASTPVLSLPVSSVRALTGLPAQSAKAVSLLDRSDIPKQHRFFISLAMRRGGSGLEGLTKSGPPLFILCNSRIRTRLESPGNGSHSVMFIFSWEKMAIPTCLPDATMLRVVRKINMPNTITEIASQESLPITDA